jgi:hypothetical protein
MVRRSSLPEGANVAAIVIWLLGVGLVLGIVDLLRTPKPGPINYDGMR